MNAQTQHYPEDFKGRIVIPVDAWTLTLILIAVVLYGIGAIHLGAYMQRGVHERQVAEFPGCVARPVILPTTRWSCSPEETRERRSICAGRAAIASIKPKG